MFSFADLEIPLVGAPMAGGPSTPQLAAAVSNTGGLGMLAAGYLNADQLAEQVKQIRELTDRPFGVNLFCPADPNDNPVNAKALLQDYRLALAPLGREYGLDILNDEIVLPDHFCTLLDWLLANPVPVVTFTFGCPSAEQIERLQAVSTYVGVTVTNPQDAILATQASVDFLCVQGPDAGGHQSTFRVADEPNKIHLVELLKSLRYVTHVPLVVAGGVRTATQVAQLRLHNYCPKEPLLFNLALPCFWRMKLALKQRIMHWCFLSRALPFLRAPSQGGALEPSLMHGLIRLNTPQQSIQPSIK